MLKRASLISICGLLLFLGGCHQRQGTQNLLVYVPAPAPPPAAATTAAKPQVLVLEEPPPPPPPEPEEEETPAPQTPEPTTHHKPKHSAHPEAAEPDETPTVENPETPPAEVPALEPRQSSAQENEIRRQYLDLEQDIRARLAKLSGAHLSGNDQKTLEDARTFFTQSKHAMATGDLPRALNLAHKAGLLLAALE